MQIKYQIKKIRFRKIINEINHLELNYSFLKRSAKLVGVQIISAVLLLINNFLLIKSAGEFVYGNYVYLFTWISLFSVVVLFGMDDYFIANLPKFFFNSKYGRTIFKLLSWSLVVLFLAFGISIILVFILYGTGIINETFYSNKTLFLLFLFEAGLLNLLNSFLRGINNIIVGQIVDKVVRPILMTLTLSILLFIKINVNLQSLLVLQIVILAISISILTFQIIKLRNLTKTEVIDFDRTLKSNFIFFLISILYLLNIKFDILFLSKWVSPEKIGYYNLSVRFADITGYPLAAASLIFPTLLSKEKWNDKEKMYKIIRQVSCTCFLVTGIVYIIIVLGCKTILSVFGKNFIEGFYPLIILGGTHLISSFSFPLNAYFMVSGKQQISLICLCLSVVSSFLACYFLVPAFLLEGAAFSVLLGSFLYFTALFFAFYKTKNYEKTY